MTDTVPVPPLQPGDPLPKIAMPGPGGKMVDLNRQTLAGHTIVLWFAGGSPAAVATGRLADHLAAFAAVEAKLHAVVGTPPSEMPSLPGAASCLFDPDGRVARALLSTPTGIVVIDPGWHLHAVLGDNDLATALRECHALYNRTLPDVVTVQAPVLLMESVLEPDLCTRLIAYWEAGDKISNGVASARHGSSYGGNPVKKRSDVMIADLDLFNALKERVARRILPAVFKAFQVRISNFEAFRVGCYDAVESGEFRRHRDNTTPYTAHRQFAVSINLNSGNYEGGQIRFPEYGRQLYSPGRGGAVVFSSSLLHEALPVTRGRRLGIFSFLHDNEAAKREREMLARHPEATSNAVDLRPSSATQAGP